ncbi:cytochrome ubiquinol oxidase subunit I [Geobacter benzoatilyticus]|uniref:Cytochrome ubiquinol oxidase subunit I n=1 Tax=Geobacter benzoatilyticus TaxID=2815309 RepID=A0ABX7Q185_9BACT|nr:cytochrome ubiquinol oxidase subunit I [Geobacter benzoatilyticus]QSV45157.1 cytochrome ubiquinol oxidase subunit I [Geobacter benzoatilyticus]
MDVLTLSRLQFAATTMFHFIFVPLTLGLSILTAYMETRYVRTGDETYLKMTKFWGKLFLINFALGVVTGITQEFQFGMNWAEYSRYVGDIFGAPLAIEATVAFFLESVFIGVWIFGWNKVSKVTHAISIWLVAIATNLSALWILLANGWMQNPVGYVLRNGRAEMVDFMAVVTNPYGIIKFVHTVSSGYMVAAFFVMGISAWHLLRKNQVDFFVRSFRMGALFGLLGVVLVLLSGDFHAVEIAKTQPTKFAAMESVWETKRGVGMNLLILPDPKNECNAVEKICIPNLVSLLAFHDPNSEIKGLKDFPKEMRPPVQATFWSFRIMVGLGSFTALAVLAAVILSMMKSLEKRTLFLQIMLLSLPLPYLAAQLGWIVAEMGRQPWIVYGVLKTSEGVSKAVTSPQVIGSLVGFTLIYSLLGAIDIYLLAKYARKGPDDDLSGIIKPTTVKGA